MRQGISAEALATIAPEIENIRVAWANILAQSDGEKLRRVVNMIQNFYFVRGPYTEGVALSEQALTRLRALPAGIEQRIAIADCLNSLGWFRVREGHIAVARQLFVESVATTTDLNAPRPSGGSTEPLMGLGVVALIEGNYQEAVRLGMATLQRGEAEGHQGNQASGLYVLVSAALAQGRYQIAQRYARRLYTITQAIGNRWYMAYCLIELGHIACALGAYAEAQHHYTSQIYGKLGVKSRTQAIAHARRLGLIEG